MNREQENRVAKVASERHFQTSSVSFVGLFRTTVCQTDAEKVAPDDSEGFDNHLALPWHHFIELVAAVTIRHCALNCEQVHCQPDKDAHAAAFKTAGVEVSHNWNRGRYP